MNQLKLAALDAEDLAVISAHMQDAVLLVGDMKFMPGRGQFAVVANRFDWEHAENGHGDAEAFRRQRTGLHFNRVVSARALGINQRREDGVLELLSITFEAGEAPSGEIVLAFAAGGTLRLAVECIEVQMSDLGDAWETESKPEHDLREQT
jgi:hypothetical protein